MDSPLPQHWLLYLLGAAAALAVALMLGRDAQVARQVFGRFVFSILLPLVVIFGLPLAAMAQFLELEVRVWQAIIAGIVIAAGWLTTAIFTELGKAEDKAERQRDYHKALYAEIGNFVATLSADDGTETLARMRNDADFVPFVPREHNDHIFDAIVDEVDVLPRQTIDAVVAYYSLTKAVSTLADDMRGERFQELEQDRRVLIYSDYLEMRAQALATGQFALLLIQRFAKGGAAEAQREIDRVNTPDAARSGPSPE